MPANKLLTITDVDACFMDEHYCYADAMEAVQQLRDKQFPLILNSSKTLPELQSLARELQLDSPIIAENGGIVAVPDHSPLASLCQKKSDQIWQWHAPYWTFQTGISRDDILNIAHELRATYHYRFTGFADWDTEGIIQQTGLSPQQAAMANTRYVTEPILWQDTQEKWLAFDEQLQRKGVRALHGGRFIHLMGTGDKSHGMQEVISLYQSLEPETQWTSLALGDSPNDLPMVKAADIGVVVPHPEGPRIQSPQLSYAPAPASKGWNQAVLDILKQF